jgi:hypothetical protein
LLKGLPLRLLKVWIIFSLLSSFLICGWSRIIQAAASCLAINLS